MSNKTTFVAAIAGAAILLSGCTAAAPEAGGDTTEITVMGYTAIFEDKFTESVIAMFEEANPDITVNYEPGQNSAEMLGRVRTENGNPTTDVVIMDASVAHSANQEGLFRPIEPAEVPNLENVVELGQNADGFGPALTFDNLVLLYNPQEAETPPTAMEDLWDAPANSVAIPAAPDIQGIALTALTANRLGGDYQEDIQPAIDELAELAPNVNTWEPKPDVYSVVTSGSAQYGVGWNARAQVFAAESNGALEVVQPSDGVAFQINTINAVEGSENTAAVNRFIDFALSAESQEAFASTMFYAPTVSNASIPADITERVVDPADPNIIEIDWVWMADQRDAWTDQWRREVIGG